MANERQVEAIKALAEIADSHVHAACSLNMPTDISQTPPGEAIEWHRRRYSELEALLITFAKEPPDDPPPNPRSPDEDGPPASKNPADKAPDLSNKGL